MEKTIPRLHWLDFVLFFAMLIFSLGIGIYHSLKNYLKEKLGKARHGEDSFNNSPQRASTDEYLLGNRQMAVIPVSLSMIVSFVSSVLIVGYPAETYAYGGQYWLYAGGHVLAAALTAIICVPVLYPLKLTSVNQYLWMRYKSRLVQLFGTVSSLLFQLMYTGAVLYTPSTAIEAATGGAISATVCILITCAVSVLYTTLGGIKAVIWTDVLQSVVMLLGLAAIFVKGIILVGGFDVAWKIDSDWGRLNIFDFSPDPTHRLSFWALTFGVGSSLLGAYGTSQMGMQRYSSLPTINKARLSVLLVIPGTVTLTTLACLSGLVIFAYYAHLGCDPLAGGMVSNPTQLVPYFVMQVLTYPGVPGIFLAAIVAGSLSSASSALNSASANILADIVRPLRPNMSEVTAERLAKLVVAMCGVIALVIAFAAMAFKGTIIQIIYSLASATTGPITAVFLVGFFVPFVNWKGALAGGLLGLVASLWLAIGSLTVDVHHDMLPSPTANCSSTINQTFSTPELMQMTTALPYELGERAFCTSSPSQEYDLSTISPTGFERGLTEENFPKNSSQPLSRILEFIGHLAKELPQWAQSTPFYLYRISYLWFGLISYLVTSLTAVLVSMSSGTNEGTVEDALLHPITRRFRQRRVRRRGEGDRKTSTREQSVVGEHETQLIRVINKTENGTEDQVHHEICSVSKM